MNDESEWKTAFIGLGSNLGDRKSTLRDALDSLDARPDVEVVRVSELRETKPVGGPPQGNFVNGAAELRTTLEPEELVETLHEVEAEFGRTREVRWGPRTLDMDLLLYEDRHIDTPDLKVPHPRLHQRRFVLEPLWDLCPNRKHPVLKKTIRRLLAELDE